MNEKPILFSTEMVQAILEGRKTQTRRICKHQHWSHSELTDFNKNQIFQKIDRNVSCKFGKPGDLLWVRETFDPTSGCLGSILYKANYTSKELSSAVKKLFEWKSSRFMPKAAARIWLQIEEIRVERLQDITYQDILQEGMPKPLGDYSSPVDWFETLWTKINGSGSWDANPWLWVIKFRVLSTTGKPTASQHHCITAKQ